MTRNNYEKKIEIGATRRRLLVASLYNRHPGITLDAITERLEEQGVINPATGKAYSAATIHRDLAFLLATWRGVAEEEVEEYRAKQLAQLDEVMVAAWNRGDLNVVIRAITLQAKLMGTEAPTRTELTGKDGKDLFSDVERARARLLATYTGDLDDILTGGADQEDPGIHC